MYQNLLSALRCIDSVLQVERVQLRCHERVRVIHSGMGMIGYERLSVVDGVYQASDESPAIAHSWMDYNGQILETDPKQLRRRSKVPDDIMPNDAVAVLAKSGFGDRYHPFDRFPFKIDEERVARTIGSVFTEEMVRRLMS